MARPNKSIKKIPAFYNRDDLLGSENLYFGSSGGFSVAQPILGSFD
jgi:hypothetical protein